MVLDREKSGNVVQGMLATRLRALEVSDPFHILWRIAMLGVDRAGCKGIVALLTAAINAWKGPWMSGAFGRELQEALAFILRFMSPSHPLLQGELHNVLLDHGIKDDSEELKSPEAQLALLVQSKSFLLEGTLIQWRRFFSFHKAWPELDQSWTCRLVCGRFVAPRFNEYLHRAEARIESSGAEATSAAKGQMPFGGKNSMAGAVGEEAVSNTNSRAQGVQDACPEADLIFQANGKAALRLHRERHGNMLELSTDALGNRELQFVGRHIYYSPLALYEHYQDSIRALNRSPMSIAQWHARRSAGDWMFIVAGILHNLIDSDRLATCGIGGNRLDPSDVDNC